MRVAFFHPGSAFLPEIDAYISFFKKYPGVETAVIPRQRKVRNFAEIEWHFMGAHFKRDRATVVIHEYASASIPPFAKFKNTLKRHLNCVPDYRVFYNETVRDQFRFRDGVAHGFRGHGVWNYVFPHPDDSEKRYDFIYTGSIDPVRGFDRLLDCFVNGSLKDRSLLVVSKGYERLAERLAGHPNIQFAGPVPYSEIYAYIRQCRYAINFMPDVYPFNRQVSAKFLDYAACSIPVISSKYSWIQDFEQQYGGRYFYLEPDLSNLRWEAVSSFNYGGPDLREWTWEKQMERSGILPFLSRRFPDVFPQPVC
ncbi:MAG: glycosyltransferase [Chitinophagaceae bacterium]|nr:glycosyltransferase [Chitinophagaceae bacterium]